MDFKILIFSILLIATGIIVVILDIKKGVSDYLKNPVQFSFSIIFCGIILLLTQIFRIF